MKLLHMHRRTNIATVECGCGGQTIIPTTGATEDSPARGVCPRCGTFMLYPNDVGRPRRPIKLIQLETESSLAVVECHCGGRALIMTKDVTEAKPVTATCPVCHESFHYPTDLAR
jgi:hypothetical protein